MFTLKQIQTCSEEYFTLEIKSKQLLISSL